MEKARAAFDFNAFAKYGYDAPTPLSRTDVYTDLYSHSVTLKEKTKRLKVILRLYQKFKKN